jgi:hypothetical protein
MCCDSALLDRGIFVVQAEQSRRRATPKPVDECAFVCRSVGLVSAIARRHEITDHLDGAGVTFCAPPPLDCIGVSQQRPQRAVSDFCPRFGGVPAQAPR